jgi:glycosyltransferase involved in cell wall biosynthesis
MLKSATNGKMEDQEVRRLKKIHIWIPDYESAMGGIQVFSRIFIRALRDCLPDAQFGVLSKNDNSFPALPVAPTALNYLPRRILEEAAPQGSVTNGGQVNPRAFSTTSQLSSSVSHLPASTRSRARGRNEFRCAGWLPLRLRTSAFALQLLSYTLRHRPDLILTTHVNFAPVAWWANRLTATRYVAVAHGVDVWGVRSPMLRRSLRGASRILAVSSYTRDRMANEMGLEFSRMGLLPNTVDSNHFVPGPKPRYLLKRFGLRPDQRVILTVARLASEERYKGYDQILRALPAIKHVVPDVRYVLGGRGRDRERIEALIRELGLEKSVSLAGYIPDHELCDFYNLCDVFAMPSKREGFGIVFLEALACGKPVLAGNKDGSVDALLGGELGVLVDPDIVEQIAHSLIQVLTRQHALNILREPDRLRARVIEAYGYDRFVKNVAHHLNELGVL